VSEQKKSWATPGTITAELKWINHPEKSNFRIKGNAIKAINAYFHPGYRMQWSDKYIENHGLAKQEMSGWFTLL